MAATAFQDFWTGVNFAALTLANLWGPQPVGRLAALGFDTYRQGVTAAEHLQVNQAGTPAFSNGWLA